MVHKLRKKESIDYETWNDYIVDTLMQTKSMSYEEALQKAKHAL